MGTQRQQEEAQYDIFLSHSGAQKGFVRDLHSALSLSAAYSVFFDQDHHSLPPGQPFPPLIFSAAKTCRLGIVVLSEEFVTSPWPMMELCTFAYPDPLHSASARSILPLFYKLSTAQVKSRENVKRWRRTWTEWEENGRRISAGKCEELVTKVLLSFNGVVRLPESEQGEASYIEQVIGAILCICKPRHRSPLAWPFDDPNKPYFGIPRMCQILVNEFRNLQNDGADKVCILGMYGVPGSGKSTLCRFLCDFMFDEFAGNVAILKLPTEFDPTQNQSNHRQIEVLTPWKLSAVNDIRELFDSQLLPGSKFTTKRRMFLVLDNICQSNYESYKKIVQVILRSASPVLDSGSRVLLVTQSRAILEDLWSSIVRDLDPSRYRHNATDVPRLTETEAISIVMHAQQEHCSNADSKLSREELTTLLFTRSEDFASSSSTCLPLVLEMIGVLLGNAARFAPELENLFEMVHKEKQRAAERLVAKIFGKLEKDLQDLFLDIALFVIPSGLLYEMDTNVPLILRHMHNGITEVELMINMDELRKHGLLSYSGRGRISCSRLELQIHDAFLPEIHDVFRLEIHDVFLEYARSYRVSEIRETYTRVNLPSSNSQRECTFARSRSTSQFSNQRFVLECHEARTIIVDMVQGMGVEVQVGREAKALIIRNHSARTNVNVCLSGDLSSLVCLDLKNANVKLLSGSPAPSGNDGNDKHSKLVWLRWRNIEGCVGQKRKRTLLPKLFPFLGNALKELHLENVAIQKLDFGSACWPALEKLWVIPGTGENRIMSLIVGNAPKLKSFCIPFRGFNVGSKSLLELRLDECPDLEELIVCSGYFSRVEVLCSQRLPELRKIGMGISDESAVQTLTASTSNGHQLPMLERLDIRFCHKIKSLEFTPAERQQANLTYIQVSDCPHLKHVTFRPGCLPNLKQLYIQHCDSLVDLSVAPGAIVDHSIAPAGSMPNSRRFESSSYNSSINYVSFRQRYHSDSYAFHLRYCQSLTDLSIASDALKSLRYIELVSCKGLTRLSIGRDCLPNLDILNVWGCISLADISIAPDGLPNLRFFHVTFCPSLTRLPIGPGWLPNLHGLSLKWCKRLQVKEGFDNVRLERIRELKFAELLQLRCYLRFRNAGEDVEMQLRTIDLENCPHVTVDINILEASQKLERVILERTCISLVPGLQPDVIYAVLSGKKSLESMSIRNISLYYMREGMLCRSTPVDDDASTSNVSMEREEERAGLFLCSRSDRSGNADLKSRPITIPGDRPSSLLTVASASRVQHPWRFRKGTFMSLNKLHLIDLPYWQEMQGIQHLVNLDDLYLSNLPNLTHVLGEWPRGIGRIEFPDCPMLRRIPSFERTPSLYGLVFIKCKELKAVEGIHTEARILCECETTELMLTADYDEADEQSLCVCASHNRLCLNLGRLPTWPIDSVEGRPTSSTLEKATSGKAAEAQSNHSKLNHGFGRSSLVGLALSLLTLRGRFSS